MQTRLTILSAMLSVQRVKELLGDPAISDREAEAVRDSLRLLAEVIFEKWSVERRAGLDEPDEPE